jgi:hypothetical protein
MREYFKIQLMSGVQKEIDLIVKEIKEIENDLNGTRKKV